MKEDFIHYLWKYKKFNVLGLKTVTDEAIAIISSGEHNLNSGPDFFNARIRIGEQLWAGNVEIHLKSSDWYLHNHEKDKSYDNVILHVVWEHDLDVYRENNSKIATIELKHFVESKMLNNYQKLFNKKNKWINCEKDISSIEKFKIDNWLERLYFERLEQKHEQIELLLSKSKNNWEAVLFKMLAKNFGLKVNGDAFLSIANSIDFSIIRKIQNNHLQLEALLFGQAGLLDKKVEDSYFEQLKKEYLFLKQKFNIDNRAVLPVSFFRLRPVNFPTIRLSQFSSLYFKSQNLFSKIIEANTLDKIYNLFQVSPSVFWQSHYTFNKSSKKVTRALTKSFIDLLIINTIIPLKFSYSKRIGKTNFEDINKLAINIVSENNNIIKKFNDLGLISSSALQSQGLLQLKNEYCDMNKCLQCAIGNALLNRKM